jgi:autotransporter-associated beta strand protein
LAAAAALGFASKSSAIDLTWSADGLVPGGSGTWDLESTTWIDELLGGDTAVWDIEDFGGATFTGDPLDPNAVPATVTLGASLSATTLTFAVDGFTLAASSNPIHTLSLSSGITADGDSNVAARLLFTGAQTWTIADGKTLTVSGDIANAGNLLSLAGAGNSLISGALSGTGGLSKSGLGNLTLSGANTFSGTTTLSAGTLTLGSTSALAGSTLDLAAGGTGTLSFASVGTYQLGGLSGTRNLALGASSLAVGGNNADTAYSGILSGTGGLTKAGTGTLTLSGVNTLTGKVAITGGAISVAGESGLGATPATATADALTLDGGALILTAGTQTFSANRGITLGAGGGTLDTSSIADTTGLSVTFAGAISGNGNLTVKAHGDLSASGGGGNTHVTLSGANTFTGTVTLSDGLVNAASGFGTAANTLRFANGGGILHTSGTSTISRSIEVLSTGGIVRLYGGATLTLSGALTGSGTLSRTDGGILNLTGDLSGFTGTFANLLGTTVIDTQGASAFSAINLTGGGLYIRHNPFALGSATITVNGSSTLGSNGSAGVALANAISISGTNTLTLAGSNAAPFVQTGAVTGASSTLILGSAVTLAASGSSGTFLTIGESSGAILAHGFTGTYTTVRFTPINIGTQGVGMMVGGSLTATSQGQDNRDAQFNFLQAGGTATFGRLATGQTESGSNEGGEGGISLYALQGGTLSLGSTLTGAGGGWADRGLHLYTTGGTMRATANGNWTPFMQVAAAGEGVTALDTNGFNATFTRNISGTGRLNLTGATGSVILNNLTAVTNSFSGSGALTKSNTSVTVFSGDFANYTGAFAISGGTAQFSSASDTAFAGAISGAGIFSKAGSGTLRLTGTNTWSSNAAITAGALSIASTGSLSGWNSAGRWSVSSGATLAVGNSVTDAQFETMRGLSANFSAGSYIGFDTQSGDRAYAGTLSGAVGISKVGANTLTLTGASAFTGPIGAFGGTLNLGGSSLASAGTVTVAGGSLTGGRITTTTAVAAQSGNLGAALLGTGGVTKTTAGVLSLSGVNSYTGATTVSAGTLVVESVDALPGWNRAGGFSVASGAGIAVGNLVTDGQFTTMLGTGNFAAGSRIGFDTSAGDRTYGSVLANTGAGALGLVKSGTGTLYAAGANTFTGSVHVAGGTLAFSTLADSGSSNLGIGTALSLDGGTLRFTGTSATSTARTLALTGSGNVIQVDAGGVLTLGPNATGVVSAWSGSGGVTKTGEGTLTVGNNRAGSTNRFNVGADTGGVFTMAEGVLNINPTQYLTFGEDNQDALFLQTGGTVNTSLSNGSYIGNGSGLYSASLVITGGTFNQSQDWMRVGNNGYARGFLTIGGGTGPAVANVNQVQLGSGSRYASGTLTLLSGGTLVANTVNRGNGTAVAIFDGGTLRANSNTSNLLSGVATVIRSGGAILDDGGFTVTIAQGLNADGVGSGGLTKLGSGTLRLVGVNTYAGDTLLNTGTLALGSAASLPSWDIAGRWTAATGTTLAVGNAFTAAQVSTLIATGNFGAGSALGFDTADGNRVFAGAVADGANGALAVTKIGANTLTLSGSSTYTGLTTVANGTLELASRTALADATNTQVRSAATLMFEVAGAGNFTNADLAALLPSLYEASAITGLRAGSLLGFNTGPGSFTLDTSLTNSTGANGGAVGLTKIGANTLTLTGTNTYSGATTISGGTLALASGASITSGGNLTLSGGAFLDLGGGTSTFGAVTVSALASSGSVIRNGTLAASSLTFNHTSGTDVIGANLALGGVLSMATAGSVEFASGTHSLSHFYVDNGGRVTISGGTVVATGDRTDLRTGTLAITGGNVTLNGIIGANQSGKTTVINQSGGTLTITGTVNNVGTGTSFLLSHWGSGGSNGTFNLSGGTLNVLNTNVLLHWDGTGTFNQSSGTANLLGLDFNTSRGSAAAYNLTGGRLNIGANGIVANNTAETFTAGAATLGALADWSTVKTISLTDATTGLTVNTSDAATGAARTITLSGILSGTGRLTVAGTGVVNLNAANTNTGLITVSGGALRLSNANSLAGGIGATGGTGALSLNGGIVDLAAGDFSRALGTGAGQVAFAGSGGFAATGAARTVNLGGAGAQVTWGAGSFIPNGGELLLGHALSNNTVTFANALALGASDRTVRVARGSGNLDGILSGAITGDGGLIKAGEGILSLTGANTYTGNTTISAGVLSIAGTGSLSGWDTAGRWSVAAGATLAATNAITDADLATLLATGNLASGAAIGFDTSAGDRSYATALADTATGALGLAKVGANTLVLSGANTHTGTTRVLGGTLRLSHASALASSTLNMAGGSVAFDSAVADNAFTAGGLAGTGNLALQNNAGTPAAITLTVGGNNASTTYAGTLSGAGSLIKSGSGTLTLAGSGNTHVGATTVSAGTLVLQTGLSGALVAEAGTTITVQHASGLAGLYSANGGGGAVADLVSLATLDTKMLGTAVTVAQSSSARGANFDFATNGSGFPAPYNSGAGGFVARWNGQFFAETAGIYTFFTASDDGSKIWINGQEVVSNNFSQGVTERSGTITLEAGWHDITAGFMNISGGYGLYANVTTPTQAKAALSNSLLRSAPIIGNLSTAAGSTVDLGSVGLVVNQTTTSTAAGALVGSGSFTKVGNGTLTLGDVDGFTGGIAVHAGQLVVSGDLALGTRSLSVGPASDSNLSRGLVLSGVVSGTSGLTKSGNGVLALTNAANTFSGGITNLTGVLAASSDGALGDAANQITLGNGAIFRAIGSFSSARTLALAAGPSTTNIQVTAGNTFTFAGTFLDASATTQLIKADHGTLALGAITATGWSGALNQLNDPSSFTGGIRVDAGVLRIDSSSALSASNVVVVNNYQGAAVEIADGVNLAASVVANINASNSAQGLWHGFGLGNLFVSSGTGTLSGELNLRQDAGIGAAAGATLNIAGNIRLTGHILSVLGAGTVNLSGTFVNAPTGLNKLGSGNLNITSAVPVFTATGMYLFGGGGTTTLSGAGAFGSGWTAGGLNVRGGDSLVVDNSGTNLANRLGGAAAFVGRDEMFEMSEVIRRFTSSVNSRGKRIPWRRPTATRSISMRFRSSSSGGSS